jgi:hypothetical protein
MSFTYSFLDMNCVIAGPGGGFPIAGADTGSADEGITIRFTDDKGNVITGADGSYMASLYATRKGEIEITLLKNSPVNALLSAMYALQISSGSLFGQNTIVLTNTVSGDLYTNEGVGFKKFPDNTYGKDGPALKWMFFCGRIDPSLGAGI